MSLPLIQQKQKTCLAGYQQLTKWYDLCHNNVCIVDWTTDTTDKERRWLNRQINAYLYICIYIYMAKYIYIYIAKDIRTNLTMNISTSFFCLPIFHKKAFPRHFRRSLQDRKLRHDNIVSKAWSAAVSSGSSWGFKPWYAFNDWIKVVKRAPPDLNKSMDEEWLYAYFFFCGDDIFV